MTLGDNNYELVRTLATVALHRAGGYPTAEEIRDQVTRLRLAYSVTDAEADALTADIEASLGVSMTIGSLLVAPDFQPWLAEARRTITPYYWDRYKTLLMSADRMPPKIVDVMDQVTERILGHCENPSRPGPWDRRGMVVGQVQSGKTGNYTGLICKAADAGYRLIVVIAGVTNKLRNQTQERIDEGFVGRDSSKVFSKTEDKYVGVGQIDRTRHPSSFTSSNRDFSKASATALGISIVNNTESVVFVIKKNATTLKNLLEWLRQNNTVAPGDKIDLPMLLIDDEADNASLNIAYDKNEVSRINEQIRDLLALFKRSSYVGYTATPFANIFIDPDTDDEMLGADLFPRDFIVSLDPPSNYFGPNRVFQDSPETFIVPIEDAETSLPLSHKNGFDVTELPPSLVDAARMFVVARAIRLLRGDATSHMSMLVNASRFVSVQDELKNHLHRHLRGIEAAVRVDGAKSVASARANPEIAALEQVWSDHYSHAGHSWADVKGVLLEAISGIGVRAINSRSGDALDYADHKSAGLAVVVVGGFALSRGITLEGLTTTYFYRRSLMYDTLMQMGRWFGYRDGYEDVCRIWMSSDAQGWYEHITEAIDLLRVELREMEAAGAAPKQFGLKVRSHPAALLITARNKLGTGTAITHAVGLGNSMVETTTLARDPITISANMDAAARLVEKLRSETDPEDPDRGSGFLFRGVSHEAILRFVRDYKNDDLSYLTQTEPVARYIESRVDGPLKEWDVLLVSLAEPSPPTNSEFDSLGLRIIPQMRAAGSRTERERIVVSDNARVASRGVERNGLPPGLVEEAEQEYERELDEQHRKVKSKANYPDRIYRAKRQRPLLMIHSLRMSWNNEQQTAPSDHDPIIAWGISFPRATTPEQKVEYVVNSTWLDFNMSLEADDEEENVTAGDDD
jgi:hypothetical protein